MSHAIGVRTSARAMHLDVNSVLRVSEGWQILAWEGLQVFAG